MAAPKVAVPALRRGQRRDPVSRDLNLQPCAVGGGTAQGLLQKARSGRTACRGASLRGLAAATPAGKVAVAGAATSCRRTAPGKDRGSRPRGVGRACVPSLRDGSRDGVVRINFGRNCQVSQDACCLEPKARPCREAARKPARSADGVRKTTTVE